MNHVNNGSGKDGYCDWVCNSASSGLSDIFQVFEIMDNFILLKISAGYFK